MNAAAHLIVVIASANKDKAEEMREILSAALPERVELVVRPRDLPVPEETGATLEQNAALKARFVREATGLSAISDDTGLEVSALGGRPGVYSARFAGPAAIAEDNVALLLRELDGSSDRSARFRTVAVAALTDGREVLSEGVLEGTIGYEPRGHFGFGYDPIFVPNDAGGRTLAELGVAEKHAISHRGRALRALTRDLIRELESGSSPS